MMEVAILIGVILAAGLLMASGVWVGAVLIGAVVRIKRPAVTPPREAPGNPLASRPDPSQP